MAPSKTIFLEVAHCIKYQAGPCFLEADGIVIHQIQILDSKFFAPGAVGGGAKDILPDQYIDCVVYGCTSGTIAAGYNSIEQKVKAAKPMANVTTPSSAAINALKKLNIKKISLFTPYPKKLNDEVLEYFKSEGFEITSNSYFDIAADYDIGKVDQNYLYDVLSKIDLNGAEALFVSCTALPVLQIIDKLEKKLNTIVLSSNQTLIWDTLVKIKKNNSVKGFGKLFQHI